MQTAAHLAQDCTYSPVAAHSGLSVCCTNACCARWGFGWRLRLLRIGRNDALLVAHLDVSTRLLRTSKQAVIRSRGEHAAAARLQNAVSSLLQSAERSASTASGGSSSSSMSSSTTCALLTPVCLLSAARVSNPSGTRLARLGKLQLCSVRHHTHFAVVPSCGEALEHAGQHCFCLGWVACMCACQGHL